VRKHRRAHTYFEKLRKYMMGQANMAMRHTRRAADTPSLCGFGSEGIQSHDQHMSSRSMGVFELKIHQLCGQSSIDRQQKHTHRILLTRCVRRHFGSGGICCFSITHGEEGRRLEEKRKGVKFRLGGESE